MKYNLEKIADVVLRRWHKELYPDNNGCVGFGGPETPAEVIEQRRREYEENRSFDKWCGNKGYLK